MSHFKNQLYRAGAGAGKTTTLTKLIESTAKDYQKVHGEFPRYIVTTFTRKATQELKERLLTHATSGGSLDYLQFVGSTHHLHISTIHGLLNMFLSRYGHHFGLDPSLRIISEREEQKLEMRVFKNLVRHEKSIQDLSELFSVRKLVDIFRSVQASLAEIPDLDVYSIEELKGKKRKKISCLIETAQCLLDQVQSETNKEPWIKFAKNLLDVACQLESNASNEAILQMLSMRMPANSAKNPSVSEELKAGIDDLRAALKEICQDSYSLDLWERHYELGRQILSSAKEFGKHVSHLKKMSGVLSQADLEIKTLEGLRKFPETARAFSKEWDYWFIDEYQDTSPLQEEIIRALQGECQAFVVGDPQQSIYLFRGARAEVFERKEENFKEQGFEVHYLETNYRSRPELVHLFNDYFSQLGAGFKRMIPKSMESSTSPAIEFCESPDVESELSSITQWIKLKLSEGVLPEDIAVLGRNNLILKQLGKKLRIEGLPFQLYTSGQFSSRSEVKEALSLLKFLVNPYDNQNLLTLLRTPYFKVSDSSLADIRRGGGSLWNGLRSSAPQVFSELEIYRSMVEEFGVMETFERLLVQKEYFRVSSLYDPTGRRESNLFKLLYLLKKNRREPGFNFLQFCQNLLDEHQAEADSDAVPAKEPKRIHLMTVHASKGLQFKYVIIPQFSKRQQVTRSSLVSVDEANRKIVFSMNNTTGQREVIFPERDITFSMQAKEREESDRVLYVAFTRAIESILVTYSGRVEGGSWLERCPLLLKEGVQERSGFHMKVTRYDQMPKVHFERDIGKRQAVAPLVVRAGEEAHQQSVTSLFKMEQMTSPKVNVLHLAEKIRRGVALHKDFERLAILYKQKTRAGVDPQIAKEEVSTAFSSASEATQFLLGQEQIPLFEIIENGEAEFGFVYDHGGTRIEGQIDLWGFSQGELWVLDYKSGSMNFKEKAFSQLKCYAAALMKLYSLSKAHLAAIYPNEKQILVEQISFDLAIKELAELLNPRHHHHQESAVRNQSQYTGKFQGSY